MNNKKQSGMNSALLLFVLVMLGFVLLCFFKLGPAYLDNRYIVSSLKNLAERHPADLGEMSKSEIRKELEKFNMVNNVRNISTKDIEVERLKEKTVVTIAYEVRIPLVANVDAVVKFDNVLDSSQPDKCCTVKEVEK